MKEYIERDAAIRTAIQAVVAYSLQITGNGITQFDGVDVANRMEMIPAADVVERVRGEWETLTNCSNAAVYCSVCHKAVVKEQYCRKVKLNFCPNCGSDMRGENR